MSSFEKDRVVIPLQTGVRSLSWDGDELVDWVCGGTRFSLSGEEIVSAGAFAYRFDRAVKSPNGDYAVLYEALGTKGLVVREGKPCREINRSFYRADHYEYPITLFRLPDGTQALVHCPEEYNRIEIEELASGRRLTTRTDPALDFFHSRLQLSPGGTYLLSAGWVWQPLDAVLVFGVADLLHNRPPQDSIRGCPVVEEIYEIHSAAFQNDDLLLLTGDSADRAEPEPHLAGYSLGEEKLLFLNRLEAIPGTIMPVDDKYVLGFYGHPKLFEIQSGRIVHEWPELKSGQQNSSVIYHAEKIPPLALDPARKRFAVAAETQITVVQLV